MIAPPISSIINVPKSLALDFVRTAKNSTQYSDKSLYCVEVQKQLCQQIRSASPLGFDWLVSEIQDRIFKVPYFSYIKGLQFDRNNLLFVALSSALGNVVEPYNQPWSRLVRSIEPSTDLVFTNRSVNERLHTDGTDWQYPNDLTCLVCLRPDQNGGGISKLMDIETLTAELQANFGRSSLETFHTCSIPWRIADELGGGVTFKPVLSENSMRWSYYTISRAINEGLASLPGEVTNIISLVEDWLNTTSNIFYLPMQTNDLLIVSNNLCLHGRTEVKNSNSSKRLFLRTKIHFCDNLDH
jgi:hypothetical protein